MVSFLLSGTCNLIPLWGQQECKYIQKEWSNVYHLPAQGCQLPGEDWSALRMKADLQIMENSSPGENGSSPEEIGGVHGSTT